MQRAGAKLVEVGTTNRTHAATTLTQSAPRTALLMKVHTSNYAISGFVSSVDAGDLSGIGCAARLPLAVDLGSGTLVDLSQWDLPKEPTVRETIAAGADLVSFSADKLLGGPQAGIVVGRADLIRRLKANPLKRALRVGKLTLAALEPVLQLYKSPEFLLERLTTLRLLTRAALSMQVQSIRLQQVVQQAVGPAFVVTDAPDVQPDRQRRPSRRPVAEPRPCDPRSENPGQALARIGQARSGAAGAAKARSSAALPSRRCGSTCAVSTKPTSRRSSANATSCGDAMNGSA
jgi:L-seryl-tRNA(Sec) selenium transferase